MLNIVLFGPPGAGKGTQAQKLIEKYKLVHLSTGDIFRSNLKAETELGLLARSYMDVGQLVPDDVTIKMLEAEVNKYPEAKGFIFDGFPRTQAQAIALDNLLKSKSASISMMLALEVNEEELKKRLLLRGADSGRPDDQNPEIIQKRINVYNEETAPVKEFYSMQGKYFGVYGIGEIETIFDALCEIINSYTTTANPVKKEEPSTFETIKTIVKYVAKKAIDKITKPSSKKGSNKSEKPVKKTTRKTEVPKVAAKKKTTTSKKDVKSVKNKIAKKITKKKVTPKKVVKKKTAPKKTAVKKAAKKKVVPKKVLKKKTTPKKIAKKKAASKTNRKPVAKKTLKKTAKKAIKKTGTKKVVKKNITKKKK